jgi:hypothetical protein
MARNRYIKLALAERCATNLQGAVVVGQADDYLLVERAAPKRTAARAKKTNAKAVAAPAQSATAFPGTVEGVSRG